MDRRSRKNILLDVRFVLLVLVLRNILDNVVSKIKVFRLGKLQENKNRPLKVCLPSPEHALEIVKNKKF